jgi:hypothetical protein
MRGRLIARRATLAVAAALAVLGSTGPVSASAGTPIHLPTRADALAFAPGSQTALFGQGGIETKIPGPVSDAEAITVDLGPTGAVAAVHAVQRLTVQGLGDFEIRVPGPARNVRALPGSQEQPGLRRGAILWQGFSPGRKELDASYDLFPGVESARLPLRFAISMTANGAPVKGNAPVTGRFGLRVRVSNVSAIPENVQAGAVAPATVASALDAVRRDLVAGRAPEPGTSGVPTDLVASGPLEGRSVEIEAPFRVQGSFTFPPGAVTSVDGAVATDGPTRTSVTFDRRLGGGAPLAFDVVIEGRANGMRRPSLRATASPVPPSPSVVQPPGRSWRKAASGPRPPDPAAMLELLQETLWRSARVAPYQQYVGDPDPLGPTTTSYAFRFAPPARAVAPPPVAAQGFRPIGVAALLAIVLAGLATGVVLWSRA